MAGKKFRGRSMVQPDYTLHELQTLRRTQRVAFGQHQVIDVLQANSGHLTKDIERMQYLLQIDKPYVPREFLLLDNRFQRRRGGPMPSAGVEIDEINIRHNCFIAVSHPCHARALKR